MTWIVLLIVMLADTDLQKRIRSAVLTVALVASVAGADFAQVPLLLQHGT